MAKACTVLVVEDEPLIRSHLVGMLEDRGCKTRQARNAAEAIAIIGTQFRDHGGIHRIMIYTRADGEVSELHIGLKGTMNALFLKDLAIKTHRGIEGRVRQGKSGGGKAYGYRTLPRRAEDGTALRGDPSVNVR
jgi:CheY-like chemotaxis protein